MRGRLMFGLRKRFTSSLAGEVPPFNLVAFPALPREGAGTELCKRLNHSHMSLS
jgi:hypothetical protein